MPKKEKYDIVIIGSGLGGLICGVILAKNGKKVCILEKHDRIGGNLQVFMRKGCSFCAGMHYGGSFDKGQVAYQVFNYLGIYNDLQISKLDENCYEKIIIGDNEYSYAMGMANFKQNLLNYFPEEKEAIEKYTKKIDEVWAQSDLLNFRNSSLTVGMQLDGYGENAYDYINSLSTNEEFKAVLAATNGLYIGNKEKTPFSVHANINNSFIKSAWRIAESGGSIAELLKTVIHAHGGVVLTKKEVVKLKFEGKKIVSAKTKDNTKYYGDTFISNLHPTSSYNLIESGKLRKAYINRINNLENSMSMFMLFVVLKKHKVKHINSNIYYSKTNKVWDNYNYSETNWPKGYMMYTTESKTEKGYAESLVIMSMMKFEEVEKWKNTTIMRRGQDYLDFKSKKEKKLLELVGLKFPNIINEIDSVYSASPLTFRDYTGTHKGSVYGVIKDCNDPLGTFISAKTRIPNFLLTGQNIGTHGLIGVTMSSFLTCSSVIDIKPVLNEIKKS